MEPQIKKQRVTSTSDEYANIWDACENGAPVEIISDLISSNIDVGGRASKMLSKKKSDRMTPLHVACFYNASMDVICLLVEKYPTAVHERDIFGWTPLHAACYNEKSTIDVVRFLIEKCPAAMKMKCESGYTPLHYACKNKKSLGIIQLLAAKYSTALQEKNDKLYTPLHIACLNKASIDVIRFLIDKYPAALKMKTSLGWTPLHCACDSRPTTPADINTVRLLITTYPDPLYEKNEDDDKPYNRRRPIRDAMKDPAAPQDVSKLLKTLNTLIHYNLSDDKVLCILNEFITGGDDGGGGDDDAPWWGGIKIVLNVRPSIVHKLHLNEMVAPYLLARMCHDCKPETLFKVVRGMPDIFKEAR